MIRDNHLTYAGVDSVFRNWRPKSDVLYEIIFSVLVTVFVYQLTKLFLELCLGQRRSGEISVSDLYIYVIVSALTFSSVISFFRSLFHSEQDTEQLSPSSSMSSDKSGRPARMFTKLAMLLLAVPGIQILGVFLGVEGETDVSFKDVSFGGLAMGLTEEMPRIGEHNSSRCQKLEARLDHGETQTTNFFRCYGISDALPFKNGNNLMAGRFVAFLMSTSTNIGMTVVVPGKRWISFLSLDINDGKRPYFLRNVLTLKQQSRIFESGVQEMVKPCSSAVETKGIDVSWVFSPQAESNSQQKVISVLVECAGYEEDHLVKVAYGMLRNVSFVSTDGFDIAESITGEKFVSGKDLVFFRRRGSNASLLAMLITTLVVIAARVIVGLVLINEGPRALEVILKDHLALKCCDSMLQYEKKVHYTCHREESNVKNSSCSSDIANCCTTETETEPDR